VKKAVLKFIPFTGYQLLFTKVSRNIVDWGGEPGSGPLRGTAGQEGVTEYFPVLIRRGGVPSGAAVLILREKRGEGIIHIIINSLSEAPH
jgi:hypothetical protein